MYKIEDCPRWRDIRDRGLFEIKRLMMIENKGYMEIK